MNHLKKIQENEELLATIIKKWGTDVWNSPSAPKTQDDRKIRHEKLAQMLVEENFSPECISLKHIESIIKITVPLRNGSENARLMTGAAYWYLVTALNKHAVKSEPMANVILLKKNAS